MVLGLGTLVSHGFGLSLVPALLPQIENSYRSGYGPLGIAVASGLLAYAIGGFAASKVLDLLPNRTVLNGTFVVTGLALASAAAADSPTVIAVPVILLGISAPISWAATTHVAARSVDWHSRSMVMGGASGGVGLGVIVNGGLVRFFADPEAWRTAFVIAGVISLGVTVASALLFRRPIDRPSAGMSAVAGRGSYRRVFAEWPGRVVVFTSAVAGVSSYTFMTFLTTTAIEEMGASPAAAGALLWIMGSLGVVASLSLGRIGDRDSPTFVVSLMFLTCGAGLGIVTVFWGYPGLVIASLGVAFLNYPVWGLVAAIATRRFDAPSALRAVSLGLVGAAGLSATASILAGQWIDRVGSMRIPLVVLTVLTLLVGTWLMRNYRVHVLE